jgi:hypothetical protein
MADKFVTKRHRLDPIAEPVYSFADVPRARRNLPKSCVVEITNRYETSLFTTCVSEKTLNLIFLYFYSF